MDFELAAHQAVQNVFGSLVKVKGCFYHLTQATFRKIQELGLVGLYREKDDIKQFCGMIDSLAFVPVKDLPQAIKFLKETCPPELEDLLDYFDTTYVSGSYKRINRRENIILKRIPPLFAPEVWNVLDATVSDGQRTNNVCEGWNNSFRRLVGQNHPSIWVFIDCVQKDIKEVWTTLALMERGEPPVKRQRKATQDLQKKLKKLCLEYLNGGKDIKRFINAVGYTIRF